jgi:hypothetical protein
MRSAMPGDLDYAKAELADRPRGVSPPAPRTPPLVGALTSAVFGTLSRLRGSRIVHPKGIGFEAKIEPLTSAPAGVELFDRGRSLPAVVRLSRSIGLPSAIPDPCGIAIRVPDAYGGGLHQDLLLVSSGSAPITRHVLVPRKRFEGGFYSSLLPYRFAGETVLVGASACSGGASGLWFQLKLASPGGMWRTVARMDLGARLAAEETEQLCFNPWHTGGGIEPAGFLNALRSPAYRGSQAARLPRHA